MKRLAALALIVLPACTSVPTEISNAPKALDPDGVVLRDLQDADFNLSEAVRIGVLPAKDPAAECVHSVVAQVAIPSESFQPHRSGLVSEAALVYIRVQQAKALAAAARISPDCEALVGRIVIDAARAGVKIAPVAGRLALPLPLPLP